MSAAILIGAAAVGAASTAGGWAWGEIVRKRNWHRLLLRVDNLEATKEIA
jgi:hypothetical protein